jgi:DNA repair ATPase RecN
LVLGILGITLSAVGYSQAKQANAPTGIIIAALIISILGTSFALIRLTHSASRSVDMLDNWKTKLEELEKKSDKYGNSFEDAFHEGFYEEYGEEEEADMKDLENNLDELEKELNNAGKEIEKTLGNLPDEEKARRLGKATGKALRGFMDELHDTVTEEQSKK